jgi:hypothetical protein
MTIGGKVLPLAVRWDGEEWNVNKPRPRGELPTLLTDVTVTGGRDPFAVGYRMTANGKRKPVAARRDSNRWRYVDPRIGKRESISLTGVAADRRGGLWAVGHGGRGAVVRPKIFRRSAKQWKRLPVPALKGEAVLTDVVATTADDAWAVGYQRNKGRSNALILRWDGKRWQRTPAPRFDSQDTILTAVSAPASGGIWVVGSGWNDEIGRHQALAAWWDGQSWNPVTGPEAGDELHDVAGSLHNGGWAVGRAGKDARATRVCMPPQASIFGVRMPASPLATSPIARVWRARSTPTGPSSPTSTGTATTISTSVGMGDPRGSPSTTAAPSSTTQRWSSRRSTDMAAQPRTWTAAASPTSTARSVAGAGLASRRTNSGSIPEAPHPWTSASRPGWPTRPAEAARASSWDPVGAGRSTLS